MSAKRTPADDVPDLFLFLATWEQGSQGLHALARSLGWRRARVRCALRLLDKAGLIAYDPTTYRILHCGVRRG